jgi:hypothetical protein
VLTSGQAEDLRARIPFLDEAATELFFDAVQPESGLFSVKDQGQFPGVRMCNGAIWFYDRSHRPLGEANARGERPPMKVKAPSKGARHLIVDDVNVPELVVVEGEGHGVALASIGYRGVVIAGGTKALLSQQGEAPARRENIFRGKTVRILFDNDEAGRTAAKLVAQAILDAGATSVAIVEPEWDPGVDVEDWILTHETRERALGQLLELLAGAHTVTAEELSAEIIPPAGPILTQSARVDIAGLPRPILLATTYQRESRKVGLVAYAPKALLDGASGPIESVQHDVLDSEWEWRVGERFRLAGQIYEPDMSGDLPTLVRADALVLPPGPFEGEDSWEQLFRDVKSYIASWVALPHRRDYVSATAYCLLTWVYRDAELDKMPELRIDGGSGLGKGRLLKVLGQLCWRSVDVNTTPDNLHRFLKFIGDATQLFDEYHPDRGRSREAQERLIDTYNLGFERNKFTGRCIEGDQFGFFPMFGARIKAGYACDELDATVRRSVVVTLKDKVEVPASMKHMKMPAKFFTDGEALRARLLAWRFRQHGSGEIVEAGNRYFLELDEIGVGGELADTFAPLAATIPTGEERKVLFEIAQDRMKRFAAVREADETAFLLGVVADVIAAGRAFHEEDDWIVPTVDLVEDARVVDKNTTPQALVRKLGEGGAGLAHVKQLRIGDRRLSGFRIPKNDARTKAIFDRHGIDYPFTVAAEEAAL